MSIINSIIDYFLNYGDDWYKVILIYLILIIIVGLTLRTVLNKIFKRE